MYCESTSTPVPGISSRIARAARRPSSVWVGGMRMSMIATSGLCALALRSSSSPSPACPTTSKPGLLEQPHDAFAQQHGVIGDDHPHGILALRVVPAPARARQLELAVERRDPIVQAAQARAALRVGAADAVVGRPRPRRARCGATTLTVTLLRDRRSGRRWSAPRRRRSTTADSTEGGRRSTGVSSTSTGTGERPASALSAAASPRSVSTAGWIPRASSRSSAVASLSSSQRGVEQLDRLVRVAARSRSRARRRLMPSAISRC